MEKLDWYINNCTQKGGAVACDFVPNLKGMMVGNGITSYEYDTLDNRIDMAYWFGLIDTRLWELLKVDGCSLAKTGAE